jgi:hypothetical protein
LLNGDVFYYPDISIERDEWDPHEFTPHQTKEISIGRLTDVIVENRKLVDVLVRRPVASRLVRVVLEIDLPYIENTDLGTFARIMSDEREALERFRDLLRSSFIDLKKSEDSDHFESEMTKIELDLRQGVRKLSSDMRAMSRKRAFEATGGALVLATAILIAVGGTGFGSLPAILGSGGGLLAALKILEENIARKRVLTESPYYYIWLLSTKSKAA